MGKSVPTALADATQLLRAGSWVALIVMVWQGKGDRARCAANAAMISWILAGTSSRAARAKAGLSGWHRSPSAGAAERVVSLRERGHRAAEAWRLVDRDLRVQVPRMHDAKYTVV